MRLATQTTTAGELASLLLRAENARETAVAASERADKAETAYQIAATAAHFQQAAPETYSEEQDA